MEDENISNSRWMIVGISFITLALAYGAAWYSFSVFFVALLKEFNWSRSFAAGGFSVFMILHGIIGPFAGSMVDRFGPRIVFLTGSLTLAVGFAMCSLIRSGWQFYIFFGVVIATGVGLIGWVPHTTVVQQWFREKRGLPMGIISSGIGIGMFLCVPSIQYLIDRVGWRMTYRMMAFFIPLIIISMVLVFLKNPPQKSTSSHPKKEINNTPINDPLVVNEGWSSRSWTVRKAATTKQFWLLGSSFFLSSFTIQSMLTHQVAFFIDHGLKALLASWIAGMIGIVSIGGKIFWGILSDKIGREITYSIGIVCSICGVISLIAYTTFSYSYIPYFYAISFGLGYAVVAALPPLISADFFEGQAYGSIFGTLFMLSNVGGACGTWFTGFFYDQVRTYGPVFIILNLCTLCSAVNIWIAAPRKIRVVPGKKVLRLKPSEEFQGFNGYQS
jgi:MFS family permease